MRAVRSLGQSRGLVGKRQNLSHHAFPPLISCQWEGTSMKTAVLPAFAAWKDPEPRRAWNCGKCGQPGGGGGFADGNVSIGDGILF